MKSCLSNVHSNYEPQTLTLRPNPQPPNNMSGHCVFGALHTVISLNSQLSTLNHHSSTLNPQPSTINPQPSTTNPQPYTLNPQPSSCECGNRGACPRRRAGTSAMWNLPTLRTSAPTTTIRCCAAPRYLEWDVG